MIHARATGAVASAIGKGASLIRRNRDGAGMNSAWFNCPLCGEECPVERLDNHVEIIECCNRKWVVRVDGKVTERFRDDHTN